MPKPSTELRRQCEERIEQQRASGLSVQRWCKENQIGLHLFYYWKNRIFPIILSRDNFIEIADTIDKINLFKRD